MNIASPLKTLQRQAHAFWNERHPRERKILRLLFHILFASVLLEATWSLVHYRAELLKQLPRLAAQREQLAELKREWLKARQDPAPHSQARPDLLRREVEQSLVQLGPNIQHQWSGDGELKIQGRLGMAQWLRWQAQAQRDNGLVLHQLKAEFVTPRLLSLEAWLRPAHQP